MKNLLVQTHRLISQAVASVIQEKLNISINKEAFLYGSIKPDFYPHLMLMSHYKDSSSQYIFDRILMLQNHSLTLDPKDLKAYSLELGIINHFLADFFCGAHNEAKKGSLSNHLLYELQLHKKISDTCLNDICSAALQNPKKPLLEYKQGLIDYINKKHIEYLNKPKDMLNDLLYSLDVCSVVTSGLLLRSMKNISEQIA